MLIISNENKILLFQKIVKIKLVSNLKEVKDENDIWTDMENIGKLSKQLLRRTIVRQHD